MVEIIVLMKIHIASARLNLWPTRTKKTLLSQIKTGLYGDIKSWQSVSLYLNLRVVLYCYDKQQS